MRSRIKLIFELAASEARVITKLADGLDADLAVSELAAGLPTGTSRRDGPFEGPLRRAPPMDNPPFG